MSRSLHTVTRHFPRVSAVSQLLTRPIPAQIRSNIVVHLPARHSSSARLKNFESAKEYAQYAKIQGIGDSQVYKGTLFEHTVRDALRPLGFDLLIVGGGGDHGIDLRGTWKDIKIIVQCKATSKKPGEINIRELEGVLGRETAKSIGVFASLMPLSPKALARFRSSSHAMIYLCTDSYDDGGSIKGLSANPAATALLENHSIVKKTLPNGASTFSLIPVS
ncbi:hypothetical protein CANCADRAFT_3164 [Tortispora caseinolytica NRRL Y-17796]|uniref:Required for respiratory growth protein 7, mitochondrial n=1 Tax=Tortispora caseinolytica NRRL Y-17796 TaxID=767744 RepID=A0A1E4T9R8_9ASCO|nr:hypothetical protein CANCADRAFT_3164 [Tortispora caseinolytica NRRL Y-17796]